MRYKLNFLKPFKHKETVLKTCLFKNIHIKFIGSGIPSFACYTKSKYPSTLYVAGIKTRCLCVKESSFLVNGATISYAARMMVAASFPKLS